MNLEHLVAEIANAIVQVDASRIPLRTFQPGAGPYGEPQLFKNNDLEFAERKAVVEIGYEHMPAKINLTPLIESVEVIAKQVAHLELSDRIETRRGGLVHPVHQVVRVFAWQVLGAAEE